MNPEDDELPKETQDRMDKIVADDFIMLKASMTSREATMLWNEILHSAAKRLSMQQDIIALAVLAKQADRRDVVNACEAVCHALSVIGAIDKELGG
jgi:hypothetical protein